MKIISSLPSVVWILLVVPAAQAQVPSARPITSADFHQAAPRGFGDRNNSWPQAMVWWHDHLYVGTSRQSDCTSFFALWDYVKLVINQQFADTWFPYPPKDPDLSCAADGADLSLQAEIWRWTPGRDSWQRVFQSPLAIDNPGTGPPAPPRTGKKLPYEIAFRGFAPHTDPDGTEALYAFGVNSGIMWDQGQLPPPRILRTTDGLTWIPVPQTQGTFLGNLPFSADHSSFRSPVSYNGRLFVLAGPVFGQGYLIASDDPARGDNSWYLASQANGQLFYETAVFNGWLYLGTLNGAGYSVVKTRAQGAPPYQFTTVVPSGAYLPVRPSGSVVSMHEYRGRLYVGTATFTEVIRINPDDTWDLVVGTPRPVPAAGGGMEWKYPLSGLDAGFGHTLNDHAWQMDDPFRYLYIGTYNAAIGSKNDPVNGPKLMHNMGAHLYRTHDGWYYSAITTSGFAEQGDPNGGRFDYGIRTMASTQYGAFFGTANDFYGLAIFRAEARGGPTVDPPQQVEVEPAVTGAALLSWAATAGARSYQVWRAGLYPIEARDSTNFEGWGGATGNKIPDVYAGPYQPIGTTQDTLFIDSTVQPGSKYMYYVLAQNEPGRISDQSNLVAFPLNTPPVTFAQLLREIDVLEARYRFVDPAAGPTQLRQELSWAQGLAAACQIDEAIRQLNPQRLSTAVWEPESTDLQVLAGKLVRRLQLFSRLSNLVVANEFCSGSAP